MKETSPPEDVFLAFDRTKLFVWLFTIAILTRCYRPVTLVCRTVFKVCRSKIGLISYSDASLCRQIFLVRRAVDFLMLTAYAVFAVVSQTYWSAVIGNTSAAKSMQLELCSSVDALKERPLDVAWVASFALFCVVELGTTFTRPGLVRKAARTLLMYESVSRGSSTCLLLAACYSLDGFARTFVEYVELMWAWHKQVTMHAQTEQHRLSDDKVRAINKTVAVVKEFHRCVLRPSLNVAIGVASSVPMRGQCSSGSVAAASFGITVCSVESMFDLAFLTVRCIRAVLLFVARAYICAAKAGARAADKNVFKDHKP